MPAAMGRRLLFLAGAFLLSLFVAWALLSKPNGRTNRAAVQTALQPTPAASPTAAPLSVPSESPATASPAGSFEVAIVIDDCGQWLDTERAFLALPVPLTLSVLPHVRYTAQIAQEAAAAGKGVMLH